MDEDKDAVAPMADDFEAMLAEEEELASREVERLEAVINALHKVIDTMLDSTGHDPAGLATGGAGLSDDQRKMINGLLEAKALLDALPNS
jgi:hypothetical protein